MKNMALARLPRRSLLFVAIAFLLALATHQFFTSENVDHEVRRTLLLQPTSSSCPPDYNLRCIREAPEKTDSVLFWHIPKSGGTSAKRLYQCMGKTIADKMGTWPQFRNHRTKKLKVFKPFPQSTFQTVNVDTTTLPGILRAKEMNLVPSHTADIIFTHDIYSSIRHLGFSSQNQGRALALFRHPIDRLVSKFYYLQIADWESGYRPHWKNMTVLQWAGSEKNYAESNYMVQMLSGRGWDDPVTEKDLPVAKQVLRDYVIVGLLDEVEESFRRFNVVMRKATGSDGRRGRKENMLAARCLRELFHPNRGKGDMITNKNEHQTITKGSPAWNVLAEKNQLDMRLYEYIETLFKDQEEIVDSYQYPNDQVKVNAIPF